MFKIHSLHKFLATITAICAVVSLVFLTSAATFAAEVGAYDVSDEVARAGETVEVYLSVAENPGIISLRCKFEYDTSVLELVKVENLGLLAGFTTPSANLNSPYTLRWANALAGANDVSTGKLARITFLVKEDAPCGDYTVSVSHVEARNLSGTKLSFTAANGTVTVAENDAEVEIVKGDLDGDGTLGPKDINIAKKLLAGALVPTERQKEAGDINGDGVFNGIDGNMLSKYVAGNR